MMTNILVIRSVEVVVIMLYRERVYSLVLITNHMPITENEYIRKHY